MTSTPSQKNSSPKNPWYKRHPELLGAGIILFSVAMLLSLITFQGKSPEKNILGLFGYGAAFICLKIFGITAFPIMLASFWHGARLLFAYVLSVKKLLAASFAAFSFSVLLTLVATAFPLFESFVSSLFGFGRGGGESFFRLGGIPAHFIYKQLPYFNLEKLFNFTGTALLSTMALLLNVGYIFEAEFRKLILSCKGKLAAWKEQRQAAKEETPQEEEKAPPSPEKQVKYRTSATLAAPPEKHTFLGLKVPSLLSHSAELPPSFIGIPESLNPRSAASLNKKEALPAPAPSNFETLSAIEPQLQKKLQTQALLPKISTKTGNSNYLIPDSSMLNTPKKNDNSHLKNELKQKAHLLEETLLSFGIEAKVGEIHSGPTITSFEVHPAVGVKVGRIKTLEHDIALNLEAKSIRIIAPIPGKAAVGIEVPNKNPQEVTFKELLAAYGQQGSQFRIPMLLGKTVNGDFVLTDLAKMPHCIIAGATGSGKSVCINSIVMSILMTATPDEIRLLMVDPKKVELTPYSELPHMLAPVITEPKTACIALNWLVKEMEKRYDMLKVTGQRNIDSFNHRKIDLELEKASGIEIPAKLPYYVAIIDELADLMMVASSDIETPIARIAQMARAVGIHLILATQRPSREVITGLIKANFPARISFKVASRINSQIILDEVGAETLLGNGDMLFLPPGSSQLMRAQGVFVRDEEINRTIEFIKKQGPPQYIISSFDRMPEDFGSLNSVDDEPSDSLFEDAKNTVLSTGNASTTFLQRKLKVGYARAASLMDELEKKGIVGPQEGAKPRKIFFPKMSGTAIGKDEGAGEGGGGEEFDA